MAHNNFLLQETKIPGDRPGNALFLYHPNGGGAKRIDLRDKSPEGQMKAEAEIAALKSQGWTDKRFAQVFFHKNHGCKVVHNPQQISAMKKAGWQEKPIQAASFEDILDPRTKETRRIFKDEKGLVIHVDAVAPHQFDTQHLIYEAETLVTE